mgnify:CR=1 FL=1
MPRGDNWVKRTHCGNGHEFTPANTRVRRDGTGRRCGICKDAISARWRASVGYARKRDEYAAIRSALLMLCGPICCDCGYSILAALEFDHRDPATKRFDLSGDTLFKRPWKELVAEADKCDIRCANCHRLKTIRDRDTATRR